ncbi:MAG: 16S rRNA (uracil(1498)-N(3))-methyltransferase [Rhodobacteraceae bacterium]|nr:16S rRNA (uracil(1498)-N(3))-methyltransferase [Paracoccaceae bacterium]
MKRKAKIRLFVEMPMAAGQAVPIGQAQAHYLFGVMRLKLGDQLMVFNGVDGEWLAEVVKAGKRNGLLACLEQTKPLQLPPDLWLMFAPIKKARTAFIVEKSVEMGARQIMPVTTQYTNSDRLNLARLETHAIEAAEQCGATSVPEVSEPVKFTALLDAWPEDRQLMFCDESRDSLPAAAALQGKTAGKWAIIIGPEGGFSPDESAQLKALVQTTAVSLGPRILRADTAVIAAMTAWQQVLGDWK